MKVHFAFLHITFCLIKCITLSGIKTFLTIPIWNYLCSVSYRAVSSATAWDTSIPRESSWSPSCSTSEPAPTMFLGNQGSKCLGPATHVGEPDGFPSSRLWFGPAQFLVSEPAEKTSLNSTFQIKFKNKTKNASIWRPYSASSKAMKFWHKFRPSPSGFFRTGKELILIGHIKGCNQKRKFLKVTQAFTYYLV